MTLTRLRHLFIRNSDGAGAVEFALAFPLLVAFAFGVFEFGRAMQVKTKLNAAASEASRILYTNYAASNTDLVAMLYDALPQYNRDDVTYTIADVENSGISYKVLTLNYTHHLTIEVAGTESITMKAIRYTPVIAY